MAVKLCWWDSRNLGDALNPYLFKAFGFNVTYAASDTAEAVAVGSYMERLLVGAIFNEKRDSSPILVWGTGFQFRPHEHLWFKKIAHPEDFIRPIDVRALRGHLSKQRVESITGRNLDGISLGDPGLLTAKIVDTTSVRKKWRLGILCHFTDKEHPIFDDIQANVRGSTRINVEGSVIDVVKAIASCEAIISSAMHPLIIADSLRIPNQWINVSENSISTFKFDDYYSIFGLERKPFNLRARIFDESDLKALHRNYAISDASVMRIQTDLVRAFPYPAVLEPLSLTDILALRYRELRDREKLMSRVIQASRKRMRYYKDALRRAAGYSAPR